MFLYCASVHSKTLCQSLTYFNLCANVIFTILPLQYLPLSWRNLIGSLCNDVTWRMVEVVLLAACIVPCEQMTSTKYICALWYCSIVWRHFNQEGLYILTRWFRSWHTDIVFSTLSVVPMLIWE